MGKDLQTLNGQNKLALWAGRISACRSSGQKVKTWCRENGICEQTYCKWQRRIFEMAQAEQEVQFAEVTPAQPARSGNVAAHKRHKKHEYTLDSIPEEIPTERIEHRLEGEELVCPQCGDAMTEIGTEVVNKLKIVPAQVIVEQHIYYSYACKSCAETADEGCETRITKAPYEKNIIPGSFATPEAIAHIMTQKFVMGSPLYRQEQEINRKGI